MKFKQLGIGLLAATALILSSGMVQAASPEYRGFWLDAFHAGFLNQTDIDTLLGVPGTSEGGRIRAANCNMIIVQVRKRFDVCYPSGVGEPYMSGLSPGDFNALAALIKAAHDTTDGKKRVEVHCWSVAFKTGRGLVYSQHIDPPTASLTDLDNYWVTRVGSSTGPEGTDGAFDPGHPKALEYLVKAHMDLVNFETTAGVDGKDGHIDGIHYDYIRYQEVGSEGYNPTSIARFNAHHGLSGDPDSNDQLFRQWRRDQVTAFVRQMYARIQKTNPGIKQSGALVTWNPSPPSSTREGFQITRPYGDRPDGVYSDWDSWMEEGILDIAVPMTYYNWSGSYPSDFIRWINFEKDRRFSRHMVIGPGTYMNSLSDAILELQLIREASPSGNYANGFCCYSYAVPAGNAGWSVFAPRLVSDITPDWADIPEMSWKTAPAKGHIMGTVTLQDTGRWADMATVNLSGPRKATMYADGTGFFAFIDLPPGNYTVTASKPGSESASATATVGIGEVTGNMYERNLVLSPQNTAPSIRSHPGNSTVVMGQDAAFTVAATGTLPMSYQWRFNQFALPEKTNDSITIIAAQFTNAGSYDVVITNKYGAVTSNPALLIVDPIPVDIIIDNTDPEASFVGIWQTGTTSSHWGSNYRFATTLNGGQSNAVFRPYIGAPGLYDVFIYYGAGGNRPTNANWKIIHESGVTAVPVNQTINGTMWFRIGTAVPFLKGTNGCVVLSNDSIPEVRAAIADAVRFTRIPDPLKIIHTSFDHTTCELRIDFSGGPGQFTIEVSRDLISWTNRATVTATSTEFTYQDPTTISPQLYYRAKKN